MAEFVNFASGTITDSPLTVGATTVNSAAFATVLPVLAAPHVMSITVDPNAVGGIPEIMLVTAHAASATVATVIRGQQTATGGSVARSHVAGTAWSLGITAIDANRMTGDPGDLKAGIWSSPPDGWLLMGQAVTVADVKYPALWAVVPASWKSGTTLNLPDMGGRVLIGGSGSLGFSGGDNSQTLVTANLPAHTHTINHNHGSVVSGNQSANHTHDIDHNHPSVTTGTESATHDHSLATRTNAVAGTGSAYMAANSTTGTVVNTPVTFTENQTHTHTVDLPLTSGLVSGNQSAHHTHIIDLPVFNGASGSTGSGTAFDTTPAHVRVNWAIKW